ncbi:hypothetical protein TKK_0003877 [Trichogramma kaykai]
MPVIDRQASILCLTTEARNCLNYAYCRHILHPAQVPQTGLYGLPYEEFLDPSTIIADVKDQETSEEGGKDGDGQKEGRGGVKRKKKSENEEEKETASEEDEQTDREEDEDSEYQEPIENAEGEEGKGQKRKRKAPGAIRGKLRGDEVKKITDFFYGMDVRKIKPLHLSSIYIIGAQIVITNCSVLRYAPARDGKIPMIDSHNKLTEDQLLEVEEQKDERRVMNQFRREINVKKKMIMSG